MSCAAWIISPAATAWPVAASARPCSADQAAPALRGAAWLLCQPGAQQVGEQLVVAPPAAHLVQWQQEQPGPLHLLEQGLAAGPGGDRVAQRSAQPLQHRGLE